MVCLCKGCLKSCGCKGRLLWTTFLLNDGSTGISQKDRVMRLLNVLEPYMMIMEAIFPDKHFSLQPKIAPFRIRGLRFSCCQAFMNLNQCRKQEFLLWNRQNISPPCEWSILNIIGTDGWKYLGFWLKSLLNESANERSRRINALISRVIIRM